MAKKIVIRVSINDERSRSKALKTVVSLSGVESAALTGKEKDQLEVIGDGIDPVKLIKSLRKKLAHADLLTVGEEKKEEKKEVKEAPPPVVYSQYPYWNGPCYPVVESRSDPCTIM